MENNIIVSELETNRTQLVLSKYLVFSVKLIAYCSGLFFFAVITPFVEKVVVYPLLSTILFFGVSVLEYDIINRIVNRRYRPKFDSTKMAKTDIDYRITTEKLILQLAYFFALDLLFSIAGYKFGNFTEKYQLFIIFGFFGAIIAFLHFFSTALLMTFLYPRNKLTVNKSGGMVMVAILFMLPGIAYIMFALYSSLRHFENLQRMF